MLLNIDIFTLFIYLFIYLFIKAISIAPL